MGEDLTIHHLYDDQICDYITQEIYNYIIYKYICLGYNHLYVLLDFRPFPILLVPDPEDPRIQLEGYMDYMDFVPLDISLETPNQPTLKFHLLISKQ